MFENRTHVTATQMNGWNDSLTEDHLWSSVNFGEAVTDRSATAILKTGDRVRVDGGRGVVEVLADG